jgi:hypothetical protein
MCFSETEQKKIRAETNQYLFVPAELEPAGLHLERARSEREMAKLLKQRLAPRQRPEKK